MTTCWDFYDIASQWLSSHQAARRRRRIGRCSPRVSWDLVLLSRVGQSAVVLDIGGHFRFYCAIVICDMYCSYCTKGQDVTVATGLAVLRSPLMPPLLSSVAIPAETSHPSTAAARRSGFALVHATTPPSTSVATVKAKKAPPKNEVFSRPTRCISASSAGPPRVKINNEPRLP